MKFQCAVCGVSHKWYQAKKISEVCFCGDDMIEMIKRKLSEEENSVNEIFMATAVV